MTHPENCSQCVSISSIRTVYSFLCKKISRNSCACVHKVKFTGSNELEVKLKNFANTQAPGQTQVACIWLYLPRCDFVGHQVIQLVPFPFHFIFFFFRSFVCALAISQLNFQLLQKKRVSIYVLFDWHFTEP